MPPARNGDDHNISGYGNLRCERDPSPSYHRFLCHGVDFERRDTVIPGAECKATKTGEVGETQLSRLRCEAQMYNLDPGHPRTPRGRIVNDRIRQPKQGRSLETMVRILDAFEKLLLRKPYELLTVSDIAREAKTGASSIYARFRDKRSILLAVQDRFRMQSRSYFNELYTAACSNDSCVEEALERVIRGTLRWFQLHQSIVKTSLLLGDSDILEATASSIRPTNATFSVLLQYHMPKLTSAGALEAAAKILVLTIAVFQQRIIFGDVAATGYELSDDELVAALVIAALAQLSSQLLSEKSRGILAKIV
jgi:AcrR family transcriptional regulator